MPAPPGPPERYTSVGRAPSAGSRASFSGTVPGTEPERSSGTRSVAHSAPVAARQERHVGADAAAASASPAASTARAPRTIRVQTPAIAPPSLPRPGERTGPLDDQPTGRARAARSARRRATAASGRASRPRRRRRTVAGPSIPPRAAPARPPAAARPWRAGGTRALRLVEPSSRQRRRQPLPAGPRAPPHGPSTARSARAGAAAAGAAPAASARSVAGRRACPHDLPGPLGGPLWQVTEECERDVQRLVGHGPPDPRIGTLAESRERRARAAAGRSSATNSRSVVAIAQQAPEQVQRDRRRAVAHVARLPGQLRAVRSIRAPSRRRRDMQHRPDRLLRACRRRARRSR